MKPVLKTQKLVLPQVQRYLQGAKRSHPTLIFGENK